LAIPGRLAFELDGCGIVLAWLRPLDERTGLRMKHEMENTMKLAKTLAVSSVLLAGPTLAADPAMPAAAKPCLGCHQVDKMVVGPAFRDVAKQYKGDPKAGERVINAIHNGSKGVWGVYTMPKQNVGPEDAKAIARWILSL
jgi:cytochrome c